MQPVIARLDTPVATRPDLGSEEKVESVMESEPTFSAVIWKKRSNYKYTRVFPAKWTQEWACCNLILILLMP